MRARLRRLWRPAAGLAAMTVVAVVYLNELFPAAVRGFDLRGYDLVIAVGATALTNTHRSAG